MIELVDEQVNPLMGIEATRVLPAVIGEQVEGGYPRPARLEQVASYGFQS